MHGGEAGEFGVARGCQLGCECLRDHPKLVDNPHQRVIRGFEPGGVWGHLCRCRAVPSPVRDLAEGHLGSLGHCHLCRTSTGKRVSSLSSHSLPGRSWPCTSAQTSGCPAWNPGPRSPRRTVRPAWVTCAQAGVPCCADQIGVARPWHLACLPPSHP